MLLNFIKKLFGLSSAAVNVTDNRISEVLEQGAIILDVRTTAEFAGGHVASSTNIPLQDLKNQIEKVRAYDKPIVTCCASGNRSGQAVAILKANGIKAYNGGSWQDVKGKLGSW